MEQMVGADNMERTGMVVKAVEGVLHDVGEIGQTGVVWFSMGVAMWQMILMARHLMFSGNLTGFGRNSFVKTYVKGTTY